MTTQSPVVSQLLGGSNFGRSIYAVDVRLTIPNMSVTYLYNVLLDMFLKELKDLCLFRKLVYDTVYENGVPQRCCQFSCISQEMRMFV
jgi:hypothetical protein